MQIHEITSRRTDEGILKGVQQAGRVASGAGTYLVNRLSRAMGGGAVGDTSATPAGTAQGKAAEISKPVIDSLAKNAAAGWQKSILALMDKTKMPDGSRPGSIQNLPERELEQTFDGVNSRLLTNLTGYQLSDISQLKDKIDPTASSYIVKQVDDMIAQAEALKKQILDAEPHTQTAANLWKQYIEYLGNAANIARFQGGSGARATSADSIPARVKNAGLTAQQLGIPPGTTVPNTGNQAINNLLTSVGVKVT